MSHGFFAGTRGHAVLVLGAGQSAALSVIALGGGGAVFVASASAVRNTAQVRTAKVADRAGLRALVEALAGSVGLTGGFGAVLGRRAVKVVAATVEGDAVKVLAAVVDPALSIGRTLGDPGRALAVGAALLLGGAVLVVFAGERLRSPAVPKA